MASRGRRDKNRQWTVYTLVGAVVIFLALISANNKFGFDLNLPDTPGTEFLHTLFEDYLPAENETAAGENDEASVHFIDVGQGKGILIKAPEKNVLIDAGENTQGDAVLRYLASQNVDTLDIVIGTHPHSDHIGGLSRVISGIDVKSIIMPELTKDSTPTAPTYTDLLLTISRKGLKITPAKAGDVYDLGGGASLTVLGPITHRADLNDMSVISRFDYGKTSFLFTGDATKYEERDMLESEAKLSASVLDLAHHGSSTSTSLRFLRAVNPQIAVVSCGLDNSYGHPHKEVVERLNDLSVRILRTDLDGNVVIYSDSQSLSVKTQK